MIVNNFEQIKTLLSFESEDEFYHLQILKRKKDCNEQDKGKNNSARTIKTYCINNIEYFNSKEQEIKNLCELFKARAYINLNKKSYMKSAYEMNIEIATRIRNKQFDHIYRAYDTVIGKSEVNIDEKRWIIDIDNIEFIDNISNSLLKLEPYFLAINNCDPIGDKIITLVPTVSGVHIITKPFNRKQIEPFKCLYPFDIHKNNPTILYYNDNK